MSARPHLTRRRARAAATLVGKTLAHRMGYEIRRVSPVLPPSAEERRAKLLASQGVSIVLDVGANAGQYALQLRRAGYAEKIVSFEPLSTAFAELAQQTRDDPAWECRRLALGNADGNVEINIAANSYSSSLLEMEERHRSSAPDSAYVSTETVPITRLDAIWPELAGSRDHPYLKLDVQGYELEVLRGAETSLSNVVGVQAELSLTPLYDGAPSFREVIDYLEARGFRLAGLEPGFEDPETGEMLQADGIFIRG